MKSLPTVEGSCARPCREHANVTCTACSDSQFTLILQLVLSFLILLKSESFECHGVIWLIFEQLCLMTQNVYTYSYYSLVFASIFYNTAPNAYRFLRTSGNCILPCCNTIRKITLSNTMSPSTEQHEGTFLYYVKKSTNFAVERQECYALNGWNSPSTFFRLQRW